MLIKQLLILRESSTFESNLERIQAELGDKYKVTFKVVGYGQCSVHITHNTDKIYAEIEQDAGTVGSYLTLNGKQVKLPRYGQSKNFSQAVDTVIAAIKEL